MLNAALFGAIAAGAGHAAPLDLPLLVDGLQGWISTTRGKFVFGDGTTVPGHGKPVGEARNVEDQTVLFGQATAGLRPTWDATSFDVPCIRSNGAQYFIRNSALAAPGLVVATVALDPGVSGFRAISGARSTQTPGDDPAEDAWTLTRMSTGFMQSLAATTAGVSFATTPDILGEKLVVMLEITGTHLQVWQAGASGEEALVGTRIASDGAQVLLAKYYNDAITAIMQGCVFDFAQYSPAPSRAERRLLVRYFQGLLWPAATAPVAATVDAGQIAQGANASVNVVTPSAGQSLVLASIDEQVPVGALTVSGDNVLIGIPPGAAPGNYSGRYCLRSDVPGLRLVDFGRVDFEVTEASPAPADLPYFGQYYGNAIFARQPGNTDLSTAGPNGVSSLFYAERTGTVTHWRYQLRTDTAGSYSKGDGGTYTVQICPANPSTKLANGAAICETTGYQPGNPPGPQAWLTVAFTTTGALTAGQPYVLRWINTHASPGANYVGYNSFNVYSTLLNSDAPEPPPTGTDPRNVSSSIVQVSGWSPAWIDGTTEMYPFPVVTQNGALRRHHGLPFASIRYSDGIWAGINFLTGTEVFDEYKPAITSTSHVRQRFRVSGATRTVSGVYIRAVRYNTTGGNMLVTLESGPASDTSGNGTQMPQGQVTVPASAMYDVGSSETGANEQSYDPVHKTPWIWVPFPSNQILTLGQIYNLRLSGAGGFSSKFWCQIRVGDNYFGTKASDLSWDAFEAGRIDGTCPIDFGSWWDSRGLQVSSDSGSSWSWHTPKGFLVIGPILFRSV